MPGFRCLFLLYALPCLPLWAGEHLVHRCEDIAGQITYTSLSCGPGETLTLQPIHSFNPGHIKPMLPEAESRQTSSNKTRHKQPTIVGGLEDRCANPISAGRRREAVINRRIIAGMSQQDVESALGKPDTIKVRNSSTRYTYKTKKGRSAEVIFDEKGCVKN
ncbi:outer membrane protein assembly factor BamE [Pseudomonas sp. T1.Ur]|uniref:outer membrane protein assembly factor BamE n=1 Tax=Pseudomonas sp. T1.Ur TaxID=2928704 RepID=UPI00201DF844|nr:outer membrane protein assembly factor BamE [Pseudomonas sp. T1.Ur]MCL6703367.1 outer membrane protein assembly factor BamE [Pseudomonas sp. T1.Ur]